MPAEPSRNRPVAWMILALPAAFVAVLFLTGGPKVASGATPEDSSGGSSSACCAVHAPKPSTVFEMDRSEANRFAMKSVANARKALTEVRDHISELPTDERARLREALHTAVETCPYTRAGLRIVYSLRAEVGRHALPDGLAVPVYLGTAPGEKLNAHLASQETRLAALLPLLDLYGEVIDEIGLSGGAGKCSLGCVRSQRGCNEPPEGVPVACKLPSYAEPLSTGHLLVELGAVRVNVSLIPEDRKERLNAANQVLAEHTAGLWNFKGTLFAVADSLGEISLDAGLAHREARAEMQRGKSLDEAIERRTRRIRETASDLGLVLRNFFSLFC